MMPCYRNIKPEIWDCKIVFSDSYAQLCQKAEHMSKINECILRPDICGSGKCIDTPDGYRCECKPGYNVGPTGTCEGI